MFPLAHLKVPLGVAYLIWGICINTHMQGHFGTLSGPSRHSLYGMFYYWLGLGLFL